MEGDPLAGITNLAVDGTVADLHRDTDGVRKLLGVEPKDGDCPPVEFLDDGISVLIVVVGDDQHCGRNDWASASSMSHQCVTELRIDAPFQ